MTDSSARSRTIGSRLPQPITDLLDETAATDILVDAGLAITRARPDYLRHKPGESTIVSYRFDLPGSGEEGLGYAQWCARSARADQIHRKALALRPRESAVGVSTIRVDANTVFYGFPNDARLRRLRWYSTANKLKRVLAALAPAGEQISKRGSSCTVLKYKPERRLVTRVDLATGEGSRRSLLVRYTTGRHAHRLAATAAALAGRGVRTPAPRAQLDDGRVGVDDFIPGVELRSWLLNRESVADQLADALIEFHRTAPTEDTPRRPASDDLSNAVNGLLALPLRDPALQGLTRHVADRLGSQQPSVERHPVLIHGDLHDKNILVDDGQVWFIDLERAALGSPAADLGRLRAHAISLGIRQPGWSPMAQPHVEAVVDAYRSNTAAADRGNVDDRTIAWHCAIALVDQALLVTRHVEANWKSNAPALLKAAVAELDRPSPHQGRPRFDDQGANPT